MINISTNLPAINVTIYDEDKLSVINESSVNLSQMEMTELYYCFKYIDRNYWQFQEIYQKVICYIENTFDYSALDGLGIKIEFPQDFLDEVNKINVVIGDDDGEIMPFI